jgi:hypothetical protein
MTATLVKRAAAVSRPRHIGGGGATVQVACRYHYGDADQYVAMAVRAYSQTQQLLEPQRETSPAVTVWA